MKYKDQQVKLNAKNVYLDVVADCPQRVWIKEINHSPKMFSVTGCISILLVDVSSSCVSARHFGCFIRSLDRCSY